ncbi:helix-turn-helix transcriptional regulator [Streptomyces sp. NPDC090036]|uniref:helix-turn-helix transcriptional regulator n=1 Tax=Streptomyces sp. NPDC090036 TaxID=3365926 RepID=UPI00382C83E8
MPPHTAPRKCPRLPSYAPHYLDVTPGSRSGERPVSPRRKDTLLTPAEAAERMGLTSKTLANWRTAGKGPHPRQLPGERGRWRYVEREVDDWISAIVAQAS